MSGGRLRLEERHSIADGVKGGLSYAEIARRIGRPTSTVSRELARNGHRDYDADRAHQASRRAPHRRVPAELGDAAQDRKRGFVEELADVLAATGMPRMACRVFASLVTAKTDTTTAAALAAQLDVSPASISKAIAYLEGIELVERRTESGSRREHYRVGDDTWTRAIRVDSRAHASVAETAQRGLNILGADSPAGVRLAKMGQFFDALTRQMSGSELANPTTHDAKTVIAALSEAQHPIGARRLADALGWPEARLDAGIRLLRQHPALADPFTVEESGAGYRVRPRPDRLSAEQRAALVGPRPRAGEAPSGPSTTVGPAPRL